MVNGFCSHTNLIAVTSSGIYHDYKCAACGSRTGSAIYVKCSNCGLLQQNKGIGGNNIHDNYAFLCPSHATVDNVLRYCPDEKLYWDSDNCPGCGRTGGTECAHGKYWSPHYTCGHNNTGSKHT